MSATKTHVLNPPFELGKPQLFITPPDLSYFAVLIACAAVQQILEKNRRRMETIGESSHYIGYESRQCR